MIAPACPFRKLWQLYESSWGYKKHQSHPEKCLLHAPPAFYLGALSQRVHVLPLRGLWLQKLYHGMAYGTRVLKWAVRGPSGFVSSWYRSDFFERGPSWPGLTGLAGSVYMHGASGAKPQPDLNNKDPIQTEVPFWSLE